VHGQSTLGQPPWGVFSWRHSEQAADAMESSHGDTASVCRIVRESSHGNTVSIQRVVSLLTTSEAACAYRSKQLVMTEGLID
jgi:hypothetical protein